MDLIIDQLKKLLTEAADLIEHNRKKAELLDLRDREISDRDSNLKTKEAAFAAREAGVERIENLVNREREATRLYKEASTLKDELSEERNAFRIWKAGEEKRIKTELQAIAEEWKKIRG